MLTVPKAYVELATHNYIEFFYGIFSFRFNFDFTGYRYNIVQLTYLWSIDNTSNYCYGLDWSINASKYTVYSEEFVEECSYGALGLISGRVKDCRNRRYTPNVPIYSR